MEAAGAEGDAQEFLRSNETWLVGTPDELVERLRELEQDGLDGVYLQHLDHEDLDTVRLVGAAIVPALAG